MSHVTLKRKADGVVVELPREHADYLLTGGALADDTFVSEWEEQADGSTPAPPKQPAQPSHKELDARAAELGLDAFPKGMKVVDKADLIAQAEEAKRKAEQEAAGAAESGGDATGNAEPGEGEGDAEKAVEEAGGSESTEAAGDA